jgi:hypothetical protein
VCEDNPILGYPLFLYYPEPIIVKYTKFPDYQIFLLKNNYVKNKLIFSLKKFANSKKITTFAVQKV